MENLFRIGYILKEVEQTTLMLIVSLIASFIATLITIPWLIKKMSHAGMVGKDMNKIDKPEIPEMGGIAVLIGFLIGFFSLIVLKVFRLTPVIMAALFTMIGCAFVGMMDDVFGLRQRVKGILPMIFALPLAVYVRGTFVYVPFIGNIDLGLFSRIILVFAITCAANGMNMLEGFNGLGTGLGIIMCVTLITASVIRGTTDALFILFPLLGALSAFLCFNKYPAKIFPGDTMMLFTGAVIASAAIIGGLKWICFVLLVPMVAEFFLKLKGRFNAECFGTPDEKGYLRYNGRTESLTHIIMKKWRLKEWEIVGILWGVEAVIGGIAVMVVMLDIM